MASPFDPKRRQGRRTGKTGDAGMTETQVLLGKITALRQRLEQAQGLANEAAGLALAGRDRLHALGQQAAGGFDAALQVDAALHRLGGPSGKAGEGTGLPSQLTSRARRLLERGRDLLARLKTVGEYLEAGSPETGALDPFYRDTAAMTEAALRMVQSFPEAPSAQLRACEGLEAVLTAIAQRVARLTLTVQRQRQDQDRLELLVRLLVGLHSGAAFDVKPFYDLAETMVEEEVLSAALRFCLESAPESQLVRPERAVAGHSLIVAQVMARVARH